MLYDRGGAMIRIGSKWLLGTLGLAAALLAGCEGGGGGGVVGWTGGGTVTYDVDGSAVDSSGGCTGAYIIPTDNTVLVNRADSTTGYPSITIDLPGNSAGLFESASPVGVVVTYVDQDEDTFRASDAVAGSSYTIDVTSYGAVGEPIEGTFSVTVAELDGAGTLTISGSFSIDRQPDAGGLTPARDLTGTWRSGLPGRALEWTTDGGALGDNVYRANVELVLTQSGDVLTGTSRVFNKVLVSGWLPMPSDPGPMTISGGTVSGSTCTFSGSGFIWEGNFTTDIMSGTVSGTSVLAGEFHLVRQW
jgi:hypothetical protein